MDPLDLRRMHVRARELCSLMAAGPLDLGEIRSRFGDPTIWAREIYRHAFALALAEAEAQTSRRIDVALPFEPVPPAPLDSVYPERSVGVLPGDELWFTLRGAEVKMTVAAAGVVTRDGSEFIRFANPIPRGMPAEVSTRDPNGIVAHLESIGWTVTRLDLGREQGL